MKYYVYKTTNNENGKIYIGVHKSEDIENDSYIGSGYILRKSIERYGKNSFSREILFEFDTSELAFQKEREIVNEEFIKRDDVYNLVVGGHGGKLTEINPFFGRHHTDETKKILSEKRALFRHDEETKEKISDSLKKYQESLTPEQKQYNSDRYKGENGTFYGRHHTEESKQLISEANTGRKHTEEARKNMSDNSYMKGKHHSEEFKQNLSEKFKGRKNPWVADKVNKNPEKIRKTAEKHRGMKRSEQACKNMSESLFGKYRGEKNANFIGYYITPYGKFSSLKSAAESCNNSQGCIRQRCRNNERKVTLCSIITDSKLSNDDLGKTWKELGWSFESVDKKKED